MKAIVIGRVTERAVKISIKSISYIWAIVQYLTIVGERLGISIAPSPGFHKGPKLFCIFLNRILNRKDKFIITGSMYSVISGPKQ